MFFAQTARCRRMIIEMDRIGRGKKLFFYDILFYFSEMTSKQVSEDNEKMSDTMYKLLKKYQAIRSIVKILHVSIEKRFLKNVFPQNTSEKLNKNQCLKIAKMSH